MDKAGTIRRVPDPDPDPALSTRSCIPGKARDRERRGSLFSRNATCGEGMGLRVSPTEEVGGSAILHHI